MIGTVTVGCQKEGKKKRYTTYGLGAGMYSLNYYSFVRLCKEASANIQIKKKVVVDLDILDTFLRSIPSLRWRM